MSALLRPGWPASEVARAVLVAGLSLLEALRGVLSDDRVLSLKWPNDVLLGDDKLGGVLIDASVKAGYVDWLVIGFGANLARAPELHERRAACLAGQGCAPPAAETVGMAILARLDHWSIVSEQGLDAVRSAWMRLAHPIGTKLVVAGQNGRFVGLSDAGQLLLAVGDTVQVISAGDVALADA